jgi:hypothetical protein
MAFVEALPAYFVDFGATATKSGVAVPGIFDNSYDSAFDMVAGTGPVFRCQTASAVVAGNTMVINGVSYTVTVAEPDGTGMTLCRLEAA